MRPCPYCGKENQDGTGYCVECSTELEPKVYAVELRPTPSKFLMVIMAIVVLYAPYSLLFFVNTSKDFQLHWAQRWPEFPGLVVAGLLKLFLNIGPWAGPEWISHVWFSFLTLAVVWAMVACAIKFRERAAATMLVIAVISAIFGFIAHAFFAM